jgi:hypothetical protein
MAARSYKEVVKNPALRRYVKGNVSFTAADSGAGVTAGDLIEKSGSTMKTGTEQNALFLGVTRNTVAASGQVTAEFGHVPVKTASPIANLDLLAARGSGRVGSWMAAQATLVAAEAGGNFANQPAGDGVTVVSSDTGDTTQTVTIYGTITGALTTVTTETVTLTGTTDVNTNITTWETILGVEISAATTGNIEVSETSGGLAITTITAATTEAGIATMATTNAYGLILRHDCSGASTAAVGLIGTALDGSILSVVDALNGTTEEDHGTTAFATVTKVLIGAAANTVNPSILTNESTDTAGNEVGMAQEAATAGGQVIDAYIQPYFS